MRSELIDECHLARCAIIYIRQSSPHQVLTNQESLRLQYDLRRRALDLGWREEDVEVIEPIEADLKALYELDPLNAILAEAGEAEVSGP